MLCYRVGQNPHEKRTRLRSSTNMDASTTDSARTCTCFPPTIRSMSAWTSFTT